MPEPEDKITKPLATSQNPLKLIGAIAGLSIILGVLTGYILSTKNSSLGISPLSNGTTAKTAQQDIKTFKDFAEGTLKLKPEPSEEDYTEGTHLLIRDNAVPVALTSSVVDLSQYEGKKVKVYGETQKALKEGWLMDVGRVDEI